MHETRLRLAQQGLPKGGAVGFELLDQEKFGISQFSEQINYQRALEGELSRTIESLGPVQNARVHRRCLNLRCSCANRNPLPRR